MKQAAAIAVLAALAASLSGCGHPDVEIHNYRFEFAGTSDLKARGYWIAYGTFNDMPTIEELMVTIPDAVFVTAIGIKYFSVRKLPGEGTLYVDIYKDGRRVLEEWTSADMEEITYQEPDPVKR